MAKHNSKTPNLLRFGIVYKISTTEHTPVLSYIGSTRCVLETRYNYHVRDMENNWHAACSSMRVMRLPHRIEPVWRGYVSDRNLLRMEQEFIDKTDCVNVNRAFSTEEETRARHNAEENARYHANKQRIRDRLSEKVTCECGKKVARERLTRHKASAEHKLNGPCVARTLALEQQCNNSCT